LYAGTGDSGLPTSIIIILILIIIIIIIIIDRFILVFQVDVYAFGMCVLEMISKETPYAECANPAQIFKRVTGQIPPQVIQRVRNENARLDKRI
jgi:hypothetical protein